MNGEAVFKLCVSPVFTGVVRYRSVRICAVFKEQCYVNVDVAQQTQKISLLFKADFPKRGPATNQRRE